MEALGDLASALGLSKRQLGRRLRKLTDESPAASAWSAPRRTPEKSSPVDLRILVVSPMLCRRVAWETRHSQLAIRNSPFAMRFWLRVADRIDRFNVWVGRVIYWLTLVMVVIGAFNALARYADYFTGWSLSSNTYLELQWYLFSLVFLLGAAYTLREDEHVRVDVLYGRLSAKGKAWLNLAGAVLFLIPFCVLVLRTSWPKVRISWMEGEWSPDPGGLPRYPIKAVILIAFVLLLVQAVSFVIKQVAVLSNDE